MNWTFVAALGGSATLLLGFGCNQILGLSDFTNACGGPLDAPCDGGGGHASSSTGAGGDAGLCRPGETKACYSGDPATADTGICHGGTKTCGTNGLFGSCDGEQLPKEHEDCTNGLDDDCNGKANDLCPCSAGETKVCYTGDPATMDVGICAAGTQTCLPSGNGFGDCMGDVTPKAEDYTHAGDENCDGIPSAQALWVSTFSAAGTNNPTVEVLDLAADDAGNVYVSGDFLGASMTIGSFVLPGQDDGSTLGFLAKFAADGTALWAHAYPGTTYGAVVRLAVDNAHGHLVLAGETDGPLVLGGTAGTIGGGAFVAAVDLAAGDGIWSSVCSSGFFIAALALDGAGNVTLAGNAHQPAFTCGARSYMPVANAGYSSVLAHWDDTGALQWLQGYGAASSNVMVNALATAQDGSIWATGRLQGSVNFGSESATGPGAGALLLLRLPSAGGSAKYARVYGDGNTGATGGQLGGGIVIDAQGQIYVTGRNLRGTAVFGPQTLPPIGFGDLLIASFDGTGTPLWAQAFGGTMSTTYDGGVALDVNNLIVGGSIEGNVNLGGGAHLTNFATAAFASRFDLTTPTTTPGFVWNDFFQGDTSSPSAAAEVVAVATSPRDKPGPHDVVLAGSYKLATDFGTGDGPQAQAGRASGYVVRIAP